MMTLICPITADLYVNMKTPGYSALSSLMLCVTMLASCSSDDFTLGEKFMGSTIRTVLIDTCTVRLSTVSIDSVVTSGKNSILAGSFSDTTFGSTECIAYIPFTVPASSDPPDAVIVFDSIDLKIVLNGTWLGDTTVSHSFGVYLLDEVITLPDDGDFYSSWSVACSPEPLTLFSFKPHPGTADTISVRLPDWLGTDLLERIMDDDQQVLGSQERFMDYLKGIAITSGPDNKCVLGMTVSDTCMVLRLHYHYSMLERTEEIITVTPFTERCFYGAVTDRSGTPFFNLEGNELTSSATGNMVLIQALTGAYVSIDFPYLNNLLELGGYCTITEATLRIPPVRGTYSRFVPLPDVLSMYVSNEDDVTVSYITTYSGDALQTGNLVKDDLFNVDTYYSYDITSFLQEQLGAIGINKRELQLIIPESSLAVTLNTLVAGDINHSRNRTQLKVKYLIYDDK
jgi:Domain of unknown function (DUF4270)